MGRQAFCGCGKLVDIQLSNSITTIGELTFQNCSSLKSIDLPNSIKTMDSYVFEDCTSLTSITIPNSVTTIGGGFFRGCTSLTNVVFGSSLATIGHEIFKGCDSLTKLVCYALVPPKDYNKEYNSWMFGFDQSKCTVYVPQASFVYYQVVNGWGKFNYTEPIETDVKNVNVDPASEQERFGLDGKRLSSQRNGLNIVRKSDGTTSKVMVK